MGEIGIRSSPRILISAKLTCERSRPRLQEQLPSNGKSEVAGDAKADDGDAIASGKAATPAKSSCSASSAEGSNSVNGSKQGASA